VNDLLLGTLDLLVLKVLDLRPLHGLGVARRIEQVTRGAFQVSGSSTTTCDIHSGSCSHTWS
jgi:DNA-binding PadR family transcriptional regulator